MKRKKVIENKVEPKKRGRKPKDYVKESKYFKEVNGWHLRDMAGSILNSANQIGSIEQLISLNLKLKTLLTGTVLEDTPLDKLDNLKDKIVIKKKNVGTFCWDVKYEIIEALNEWKSVVLSENLHLFRKSDDKIILRYILSYDGNEYYDYCSLSEGEKKVFDMCIEYKPKEDYKNLENLFDKLYSMHDESIFELSIVQNPKCYHADEVEDDYMLRIGDIILLGYKNKSYYFKEGYFGKVKEGWSNYVKEINEEALKLIINNASNSKNNVPGFALSHSEFISKLYFSLTNIYSSNVKKPMYYTITIRKNDDNIFNLEKELTFYKFTRYVDIEVFEPIFKLVIDEKNYHNTEKDVFSKDVFVNQDFLFKRSGFAGFGSQGYSYSYSNGNKKEVWFDEDEDEEWCD